MQRIVRGHYRHRLLSGGLVLCALLCGCQSRRGDIRQFLDSHEHEVSAIEYRVGIPDVLGISSPQVLEIDRTAQPIRPDGKISLRLLGPVKVAGLTEKEVAAKLTRLLQPYYEDPKVQVRVRQHASKKIYVFGQVGGSGGGGGAATGGNSGVTRDNWIALPYTGRDTVLDVLAKTGLSFIAWRSKVELIRTSPDENERHIVVVDVDRMMRTGDTSDNVLLQPGDILHVPPTPLGWLGLRIQELLFPFQPVINAYSTPASVIAAQEAYEDDD